MNIPLFSSILFAVVQNLVSAFCCWAPCSSHKCIHVSIWVYMYLVSRGGFLTFTPEPERYMVFWIQYALLFHPVCPGMTGLKLCYALLSTRGKKWHEHQQTELKHCKPKIAYVFRHAQSQEIGSWAWVRTTRTYTLNAVAHISAYLACDCCWGQSSIVCIANHDSGCWSILMLPRLCHCINSNCCCCIKSWHHTR